MGTPPSHFRTTSAIDAAMWWFKVTEVIPTTCGRKRDMRRSIFSGVVRDRSRSRISTSCPSDCSADAT